MKRYYSTVVHVCNKLEPTPLYFSQNRKEVIHDTEKFFGIKSLLDYVDETDSDDEDDENSDGYNWMMDDEEYKLFMIPTVRCKDILVKNNICQEDDHWHENVSIYVVASQHAGVFQHLQFLRDEGCFS